MENLTHARVRYADTDQMGFVHHAKYLEYFEIGRTEYMKEAGYPYADVEREGLFLVISQAHLRYRSPARYDMTLTIRTRVAQISHAQVKFEYAVENEGATLCEGWTAMACIDGDSNLKRIPEHLRKALKGEKECIAAG